MNGRLDLQLGDPLASRDQLSPLAAGQPGRLAAVDQVLAPSVADRPIVDFQISRGPRDRSAGFDEIKHLPAELRRVTPGHAVLHS